MDIGTPDRQGATTESADQMSASADLFAGQPHPNFLKRLALYQSGGIAALQRTPAHSPVQAPRLLRKAPPRPRHAREAPQGSLQYANPMATTAARDDRLTPNAKALLQVIRARCGKGRTTSTCKTTLASIMSRSCRTIRRYLLDLVRFGYLSIETRCTARGLHTGLVITITENVLPFFSEPQGLARWMGETANLPFALETPGIGRVTLLSPKNQIQKIHSFRIEERALEQEGGRRRPPG